MIKATNFLIYLMDGPQKYMHIFSPSEISIIIQAVFIPNKVRIPEPCKLLLNSLSFALLHREATFMKMMDTIASDMKGDRYNREFIIALNEFTKRMKSDYAYGWCSSIPTQMRTYENTLAGKNHDYYNMYIADLEAEYIHCPMNICFNWFKKIFYSFLAQTVCKESINDIPIYEAKDILGNTHFNEVLLTQYIRQDYLTSLQFYSIHMNVGCKLNLGALDRSEAFELSNESSNSQLKWYVDMYDEMKDNMLTAIKDSQRNFNRLGHMHKNDHLQGIAFSKQLNKKLGLRGNKLLEATKRNLKLLEPLQRSICTKNTQHLDSIEHDFLMQRAYNMFSNFITKKVKENSQFETLDQQRFEYLIKSIFVFSKAGRLDVVSKYTCIKGMSPKFQKDKNGLNMIEKAQSLIKAIECYQTGKWSTAIEMYLQFLNNNYRLMGVDQWLRIFESMWYLAIVNTWGSTYHVFLPVNALNYVHESANVLEAEDENMNYNTIHTYERSINLEENKSVDQFGIFTKMLNHFKRAHEEYSDHFPQYMQKVMISMFNMVGTLITDCENANNSLCNSFEFFLNLMSESEVLQKEN